MNAAVLALLGLPAHVYLTTTDPEERAVLEAVGKRAAKLKAETRGD